MKKIEILLAEDNELLREGLTCLLEAENYAVRSAEDGDVALAMYHERLPDLIILDVAMPKKDGYAVCEEIRRTDKLTPIIFLTAKDGADDELRGLALGACDYISKYTSGPVLLARIACAIRYFLQYKAESCTPADAPAAQIKMANVVLDEMHFRVVQPSGKAVAITRREMKMLVHFALNPRQFFSRAELTRQFWGADVNPATVVDAIKTQISALRRKLGPSGKCLCCRTGIGYGYVPED